MSRNEVLSQIPRADGGLNAANLNGGPLAGFRNKVINGNFDIWQRGTSFSLAGAAYTADRWLYNPSGGAATISRQTFALGQTDVPGNPTYFMRFAATVANDFTGMFHRIEDVTKLANKRVTLTFWAKGTNPGGGSLNCEFLQVFGVGGSEQIRPPVQSFSLTAQWQKFAFVFDLLPIEGKTLGDRHQTTLVINQGGDTSSAPWDMDLAHVSLVEGDATEEDDPFEPRHPAQELALCQRYFCKTYQKDVVPGSVTNLGGFLGRAWGAQSAGAVFFPWRFPVTMRAVPAVVVHSTTTGAAGKIRDENTSSDLDAVSDRVASSGCVIRNSVPTIAENLYSAQAVADAEL